MLFQQLRRKSLRAIVFPPVLLPDIFQIGRKARLHQITLPPFLPVTRESQLLQ